jgi:hypothetical protein
MLLRIRMMGIAWLTFGPVLTFLPMQVRDVQHDVEKDDEDGASAELGQQKR